MSSMQWKEPQKRRNYYKVQLIEPLTLQLGGPIRFNKYDAQALVLTKEDFDALKALETRVVKEVQTKNITWFRNCMTPREIRKGLRSSLAEPNAMYLNEDCDASHQVLITGVRIYRTSWSIVWEFAKDGLDVRDDDIGVDRTDLEDATDHLSEEVTTLRNEIAETVGHLTRFSGDLEALFEGVQGSVDNLEDWNEKVDRLMKKIALYRSGVLM